MTSVLNERMFSALEGVFRNSKCFGDLWMLLNWIQKVKCSVCPSASFTAVTGSRDRREHRTPDSERHNDKPESKQVISLSPPTNPLMDLLLGLVTHAMPESWSYAVTF